MGAAACGLGLGARSAQSTPGANCRRAWFPTFIRRVTSPHSARRSGRPPAPATSPGSARPPAATPLTLRQRRAWNDASGAAASRTHPREPASSPSALQARDEAEKPTGAAEGHRPRRRRARASPMEPPADRSNARASLMQQTAALRCEMQRLDACKRDPRLGAHSALPVRSCGNLPRAMDEPPCYPGSPSLVFTSAKDQPLATEERGNCHGDGVSIAGHQRAGRAHDR
jgi:hypothetical protein